LPSVRKSLGSTVDDSGPGGGVGGPTRRGSGAEAEPVTSEADAVAAGVGADAVASGGDAIASAAAGGSAGLAAASPVDAVVSPAAGSAGPTGRNRPPLLVEDSHPASHTTHRTAT